MIEKKWKILFIILTILFLICAYPLYINPTTNIFRKSTPIGNPYLDDMEIHTNDIGIYFNGESDIWQTDCVYVYPETGIIKFNTIDGGYCELNLSEKWWVIGDENKD